MQIEISDLAKLDIARSIAYLEPRSPMAAERLSQEIENGISALGEFPLMGRPRPEFGLQLRSLTVSRHLIIYRLEPKALRILRVLDGRMDVEAELLK